MDTGVRPPDALPCFSSNHIAPGRVLPHKNSQSRGDGAARALGLHEGFSQTSPPAAIIADGHAQWHGRRGAGGTKPNRKYRAAVAPYGIKAARACRNMENSLQVMF